jgi:N-acetylglutamate synthase-like GNAT family acetyltransferase
MGVGSQLLNTIETKAKELGIKRLFTEASITAKGFFERRGFQVIKQQEVELRGMKFINYCMDKEI